MKRSAGYLGVLVMLLIFVATGCGPRIYNDGTYKGISTADQDGFAVAEITVASDKIAEVKLSEFTICGLEKDLEAYEYQESKAANEKLSEQFVGRKDADVDIYTGATESSKKYIMAVSFALEKARITPEVETKYFDGTFLGKSSVKEGGYGIALITIENDRITKVRLLEFDENNEPRDFATYPHTPVLQAKEHIEKTIVDKNSVEVEGFSGATISSQRWIEAVADALNAARVR